MRSSIYLLIVLSAFMCFNSSCNKTSDLLPTPIDSIASVLPKLVIVNDVASSYSSVFSIKYDTTNLKIEMYQDDTTNTNPYDVLAQTNVFNDSGYLVAINNVSNNETINIMRATDNKILWMRKDVPNDNALDTTFYQYQQLNGNTVITTLTNSYYSGVFQYAATGEYTYNSNLKLIHLNDTFGNDDTLIYNANGSISKVVHQAPGLSGQQDYTYNAGIPDGQSDVALNVFMGRDFYIYGLKELHPLNVFVSFPAISGTDPYHLSRLLDTDNSGTPEDRTYLYELNADNLVSKITITSAGISGPTIYEFRY